MKTPIPFWLPYLHGWNLTRLADVLYCIRYGKLAPRPCGFVPSDEQLRKFSLQDKDE